MSEGKVFGIIGSLLVLIAIIFNSVIIYNYALTWEVPTISTAIIVMIFFCIGLILILIALKFIANELKDQSIFNTYLLFFILWWFAYIFPFTNLIKPSLALIITQYLFYIIATVYLSLSFRRITGHTGNIYFKETGDCYPFIYILLLISSIVFYYSGLNFIFVPLIVFIFILFFQIAAFFKLSDDSLSKVLNYSHQSYFSSQLQNTEGRGILKEHHACMKCGRRYPNSVKYCPYCGTLLKKS